MPPPAPTSQAIENYLKAILAERGAEGRAAVGALARHLRVTPGTVTSMVKRLARRGLVRHERYGGVALSAAGERAALAVLRRHRLIETFLVRVLGLDWSEVHEEAERLEHALSDRVLDRLDAFLGHPATDPHGDPIPGPGTRRGSRGTGSTRAGGERLLPLSELPAGGEGRVRRVLDQSAEFLRFLDRHGLKPGALVRVEAADAAGGTLRIRRGRRAPVSVGAAAAARMLVLPAVRGGPTR